MGRLQDSLCCGCCTLRIGCLIIGWFAAGTGLCAAFNAMSFYSQLAAQNVPLDNEVAYTMIGYILFNIVDGAVLLYGTYKKNGNFLLLSVVINGVRIFLTTILLLDVLFVLTTDEVAPLINELVKENDPEKVLDKDDMDVLKTTIDIFRSFFIVMIIVEIGLTIYCTLVVNAHRIELKEEFPTWQAQNRGPQFSNVTVQVNGTPQQTTYAPLYPNAVPVYPNAAMQYPNAAPMYPNAAPQYPNAAPPYSDAPPKYPL